MNETFDSKVDRWLVVLVTLALAGTLVQAVVTWRVSPAGALFAVGVDVGVVLLLWLIGWPCRYTLEHDHLLIQSGRLRRRVAYRDITGVAPSANPLSAPALSLQRVRVDCAGRFVLVSPEDRDRFITRLTARVNETTRLVPVP